MNTTRAEVIGFTRFCENLLRIDVEALPTEKRNASPGGAARTPLNLVAECARTNGILANFLGGVVTPRLPDEERKALLASYDTEEKAFAFLEAETDRLVNAIEAIPDDLLNIERPEGFMGEPSSPLSDAGFGAVHMMYHIGQLNYIQTIYGDVDIHWWK